MSTAVQNFQVSTKLGYPIGFNVIGVALLSSLAYNLFLHVTLPGEILPIIFSI